MADLSSKDESLLADMLAFLKQQKAADVAAAAQLSKLGGFEWNENDECIKSFRKRDDLIERLFFATLPKASPEMVAEARRQGKLPPADETPAPQLADVIQTLAMFARHSSLCAVRLADEDERPDCNCGLTSLLDAAKRLAPTPALQEKAAAQPETEAPPETRVKLSVPNAESFTFNSPVILNSVEIAAGTVFWIGRPAEKTSREPHEDTSWDRP